MFQIEPQGSDIRETLNLTPFYLKRLKRLKGAHPGVPTGLTCLTYLPTPWALPDVRQVTYVRAFLPTGLTCLTYLPTPWGALGLYIVRKVLETLNLQS